MAKSLSKTNFLTCLDCSKNAWLKIHKPDIYKKYPLSSFELNIINTGNQIDELARGLFPNGTLVESRDDTELTERLMVNKTTVIYQPVFSTEKLITASDIFVWNSITNLYDLYEVKSSTSSEEGGGRKTEDYLIDIAFQKNILNDLGIEIGTLNLIRLNKEYVRIGDINLKELFIIENVTDQVNEKLGEIRQKMEGAYELLVSDKEPSGHCDCILKGWNSHCTTSEYSNHDLPEYPVHAIARINKKKLTELVDSNIFSIHDVPTDFELSDNQRRQVDTAQSDKEYIDSSGISEFLETMKYPLAFLDYETYPSAIPKYSGHRPYQQIPFQFSLHVINSHGDELTHYDFIYTEQGCPDEFVFLIWITSVLSGVALEECVHPTVINTIEVGRETADDNMANLLFVLLFQRTDRNDPFFWKHAVMLHNFVKHNLVNVCAVMPTGGSCADIPLCQEET